MQLHPHWGTVFSDIDPCTAIVLFFSMREVPEQGRGASFEGIWDTASWPVEGLSLQIAPENWRVSGLAAGLELGNKKIFPRRDGSDAAQLRGLLDLFLVLILQFVLIFFSVPSFA